MEFHIELTELALEMIGAIKDRREQQGIINRIQKFKSEPRQQGKPLTGDLKGLYSVRVDGQRYQIVYQVKSEKIIVIVVGVGRRKEGCLYFAEKAPRTP